MGRTIVFRGSAVLGVMLIAMPPARGSSEELTLHAGARKTCALRGMDGGLRPVCRARSGDGAGLPRQGEIEVSISTTAAVGPPKLHVYNRYGKAVRFKVAAMNKGKLLEASDLCGRVETDSWTLLPTATTDVLLSRFVEIGAGCP